MKHYRIRYYDEASAALRESAAYIKEQAGPGVAGDWLRSMLEAIDKLEMLPTAYPQVTVMDGRAVRSMLVLPYRVYFVIDELSSTVFVIDIVHTARETELQKYRQ